MRALWALAIRPVRGRRPWRERRLAPCSRPPWGVARRGNGTTGPPYLRLRAGPTNVQKRARLADVADADWALAGPLDLPMTLGPLVRGHGDRTIRLASMTAWLALRTASGPATVELRIAGDRLHARGWGPGANTAVERAPTIVGLGRTAAGAAPLPSDGHPIV